MRTIKERKEEVLNLKLRLKSCQEMQDAVIHQQETSQESSDKTDGIERKQREEGGETSW